MRVNNQFQLLVFQTKSSEVLAHRSDYYVIELITSATPARSMQLTQNALQKISWSFNNRLLLIDFLKP